jgi:hypothetical protein
MQQPARRRQMQASVRPPDARSFDAFVEERGGRPSFQLPGAHAALTLRPASTKASAACCRQRSRAAFLHRTSPYGRDDLLIG